jgi:hypothetical protein
MTLCVAWIRQVGDVEELVFATDSMLTGGEKWSHGIKLFELPRKDCLLCFCGSTGRAYPLILNLISSIGFEQDFNSAATRIEEILDHISELFTNLTKEVEKEVKSENIHELRGSAKFLFGGWDWQKGIFRVWNLYYSQETEGFVFDEITNDNSMTRFYKFIGDAQIDVEEEAKKRFRKMMEEEDLYDKKLDMEPLKVLKNISLDANIREVGGSLQIAKVYKSSRTEFFGIIWQSSEGVPHFQGRKYDFFKKPDVRYFNPDNFELIDIDLPQSITLVDPDIYDGNSDFIKGCYSTKGRPKDDLTENQRRKLKKIFQEVAYKQFLYKQLPSEYEKGEEEE